MAFSLYDVKFGQKNTTFKQFKKTEKFHPKLYECVYIQFLKSSKWYTYIYIFTVYMLIKYYYLKKIKIY